jgi:N6-L-threonylcarbamoyladenine synthase
VTQAGPAGPGAARLVLGIETSCDETACAVVADGREVLANVVASQHELHAEYRGVVPEIASRAHVERIAPVLEEALAQARVTLADLHAVSVGNRPGLIGALLVGVAAAKALSWSLGVPLVGVDHVHAHLYAGCLTGGETRPAPAMPAFPALGLVVSGGHTAMFRCESPTSVRRLGGTIDDAAGEAFDKAAAILGLPHPGGPNVDAQARAGNPRALELPTSRLSPDSLDFSFSGLKTALLYAVKGVPGHRGRPGTPPSGVSVADACASFQRAVVEAIVLKLGRALDRHPECRVLLTGGGVIANSALRGALAGLARERGLDLRLPSTALCVDNGAMIAGLGHAVLQARAWASDPLSMSATPTVSV